MTVRIYKIKARDVVEGMMNTEGLTVTGIDRDHETVAFRFGPVDTTMDLDLDAMVEVTLPGPSPRELLCSCCGGDWCGDDHRCVDWRKHGRLCPVRRMRLRLWPVGATWKPYDGHDPSGTGGWWVVKGHMVDNDDLRDDFEGWIPPVASMLRAAFCEPEVRHG